MLRRHWEAVNRLQQIAPAKLDPQKSHARKVAREIILGPFPGHADHRASMGANTVAYLLIDMEQYGRAVVSSDDIYDAADVFASEVEGVTTLEIVREAKTWLGSINLEEVETKYSNRWPDDSNVIWVAPLFPTLEDISIKHSNPPALRMDTIESDIREAFDEPLREDESDLESLLELDDRKMDGYRACVYAELDDNWTPIDRREGGVWANPEIINEMLQRKGDKLSYEQVVATLSEALGQAPNISTKVASEGPNSEEIGPLLSALEESYEWYHLTTIDGTTWYDGVDAIEEDYQRHGTEAKEILRNRSDASMEKLERAVHFFNHNRRLLVEWDGNRPAILDRTVRELRSQIRALKEEKRLEDAAPGGDMASTFEAETPKQYHVAKELDKRYEQMKKERQEDEDGFGGKGISEYRY